MSSGARFRLTLIYPCVGRTLGMRSYIRTWLMEPLAVAVLAALVPDDVEVRFYDDRLEPIPFDEPTDLVALSVETFTARRAYQIASEFRRRRVPVVMGGFHPTLVPEEAARFADSVVIGDAEELFEQVVDDHRHGTPQKIYRASARPGLGRVRPDRSVFGNRRYLPVRLVEATRGCRHTCEFCAVQTFHGATVRSHPVRQVVEEVQRVRRHGRIIFLVDDNFCADMEYTRRLLQALVPLNVRWVSQASLEIADDPETLELLRRSGCQALLVGFESLSRSNLQDMGKGVNLAAGDPAAAIARLRAAGVNLYGTFVLGYDGDTEESIARTVEFAISNGLYLAAFNHVKPFPGTALYERLAGQGRLLRPRWWLDADYRYNQVPFQPHGLAPERLTAACVEARRRFYSWPSILARGRGMARRFDPRALATFLVVNALHRREGNERYELPLGDAAWQGELLECS